MNFDEVMSFNDVTKRILDKFDEVNHDIGDIYDRTNIHSWNSNCN